MRAAILIVAIVAGAAAAALAGQEPARPKSRVFPPEELGRLAPPDRDEWQQPDKIMDALGIADGNRVADVAAAGGWFTIRLAKRVGPNGRVYAEDINPIMLESIQHATDREGLHNVERILGTTSDTRLPPGLQAALIVDAYFYLEDPIGILRNTGAALAPNGRLGIVDFKKDGAGGPGPELDRRIDPDVIVRAAQAAGLKLRSHETFLRYQYLLVFGK